ncbi:PAS domain-containing sensor histidine kinase [Myxococcota bacterium]|nr:PAS domain-containing sensor histidine kinase [Myxococcota bacterium]
MEYRLAASTLEKMLETFKGVIAIQCDPEWTIRHANRGFSEYLGLPQGNIPGRLFLDYLTMEARGQFLEWVMSTVHPEPSSLFHFVSRGNEMRPLRLLLERQGDGWLVIGEPQFGEDSRFQLEMVELNNQLANLTRENARKSRQLALALQSLKDAQSMLVHREKMASLGQMTAGIAHEINNPIAFILSNQVTLARDFSDLKSLIDLIHRMKPQMAVALPELLSGIDALEQELDIAYLGESIPRKIEANLEGLRRVKQIVLNLRSFSRLDEAEMKLADLSDGILNAIQFLAPMTAEHQVRMETHLDAIPPVLCSHGAMNQAISNLLINAIQASRPGGSVRVTLCEDPTSSLISVEDDGEGIPEENLGKIFDPFFTTKPVGTGTGLGLSIASQIVASHHGAIEVDSRPGRGTRMTIRLPKGMPAPDR